MEYGILILLALTVGAGVTGGLLSAWACHRRILALEETFKLIMTSYEDRINQLTKIVVRQDKSEAAKARWQKDDKAVAELMKLTGPVQPAPHPWDPRTWGNSDGH